MRQLIIPVLCSLLFWSCRGNSSKVKTFENQNKEAIAGEVETDTVQKSVIINAPCAELQEFVLEIEQQNWVSDADRLRQMEIYKELNRQGVTYFNNRPFYPISFENSSLGREYNSQTFKKHFASFDIELLKGAKSIWGYFYRDKLATDWVSDGLIEQWEFESAEQAAEAMKQFQQIAFIVYFNTHPFFCRIGNKLIIFHTRAMSFSRDQKSVFEKFVKEYSAMTLNEYE